MSKNKAGPQKYQSDVRDEYANRAILLTLICNPEIYSSVNLEFQLLLAFLFLGEKFL